jgi:hypothetical protein
MSPTKPWSALQLLPSSAKCMCLFCVRRSKNGTLWVRTEAHLTQDLTSLLFIAAFPEMENWNYDNCRYILPCVLLSLPAFESGVTNAPEVLKWPPHRWGYPVSTRHHWRLWTKGITSCDLIGQWTQVIVLCWYQVSFINKLNRVKVLLEQLIVSQKSPYFMEHEASLLYRVRKTNHWFLFRIKLIQSINFLPSFSLLSLVWKSKRRLMRSPYSPCVCVSPAINFCLFEPIFKELHIGIHIVAPEPIPTAYFIYPSHLYVCLHVYPHIVAKPCGPCRIEGK